MNTRIIGLLTALSLLALPLQAQVALDLKEGDSVVSAALTKGTGDHVVIGFHGLNQSNRFYFHDNSAHLGTDLAVAGFRVISVNWAGRPGGGFKEADAAIAHAKATGAKKVSLMGFSNGAEMVANYARTQPDGTFDTLVLFSTVDDRGIELAKTKKLFVFNKGDNIARWAPASAEKSAEPKQVLALEGSGHLVKALKEQRASLPDDVVQMLKK